MNPEPPSCQNPAALGDRLPRWRGYLIVLAVWACIYAVGLDVWEVHGEEARRALAAEAMLDSGHWIVPHIEGQPYFKKPPGMNWLIAAAFAATGERTDWAARLATAVTVLAMASLLVWLPNRWLDARARTVAALVFLTCGAMLQHGRQCEIDGAYAAFTGMALAWWLSFQSRDRSPWAAWLGAAVLLGYAALMKGPLHALPFYAVAVACLHQRRRLGQLLGPAHLTAVAVMLAMGGGWLALARSSSENPQQMAESISGQFLLRLLPTDAHATRWAESVGGSVLQLLPWALLMPLPWIRRFVGNLPADRRGTFRALRWGALAGFVLLNLLPGLRPRYTLPALPGLAIVLGWVLAAHDRPIRSDKVWKAALLVAWVLLPAVAVGVACARPTARAGAVATGIALTCLAMLWRSDRIEAGFRLSVATAVCVALFVLGVSMLGAPLWQMMEKRRPAAAAVDRLVPPGRVVHHYTGGYSGYKSFPFYISHPIRYVHRPEQLDANVEYLLISAGGREQREVRHRLRARGARKLVRFPARRDDVWPPVGSVGDGFELLQLARPIGQRVAPAAETPPARH